MSIADTGRFWEILVIPVLQILEDSEKYWLYQYCRYWKILENTGYTSIALPVSLYTVCPLITDAQRGQKNNIQVHSATSYLIFQYLQYWYNYRQLN
jgi:hypothetical protein